MGRKGGLLDAEVGPMEAAADHFAGQVQTVEVACDGTRHQHLMALCQPRCPGFEMPDG